MAGPVQPAEHHYDFEPPGRQIDWKEYVDALVVWLTAVNTERDRRTEQRFADGNIAVNAALIAQEKAVNAALTAANAAVTKAEVASEKRFESQNEFRAQLADQAARLLSRAEAEARFMGIAEKIDNIGALVGMAIPRNEVEARLTVIADKIDVLSKHERFAGGRTAVSDTYRATMYQFVPAIIAIAVALYAVLHK